MSNFRANKRLNFVNLSPPTVLVWMLWNLVEIKNDFRGKKCFFCAWFLKLLSKSNYVSFQIFYSIFLSFIFLIFAVMIIPLSISDSLHFLLSEKCSVRFLSHWIALLTWRFSLATTRVIDRIFGETGLHRLPIRCQMTGQIYLLIRFQPWALSN